MKTMKFFVIVAIFVLLSFLTGCMKKRVTPSDIEVRINFKPANITLNFFGYQIFTAIAYEGTVTNTSQGKARLVEIEMKWELSYIPRGGTAEVGAHKVELLKNLCPGETRQIFGIMQIRGLNESGIRYLIARGGGLSLNDDFPEGEAYYNVNVYP